MCGIWGLVSVDHELNPKTIDRMVRNLMVLSESRGKEARRDCDSEPQRGFPFFGAQAPHPK